MADDLNIDIKTTADTSGLKKVDESLKDIGKTANKAAPAIEGTGEAAEETAEQFDIMNNALGKTQKSVDNAGQVSKTAGKKVRNSGKDISFAATEADEMSLSLDNAGLSATSFGRVAQSAMSLLASPIGIIGVAVLGLKGAFDKLVGTVTKFKAQEISTTDLQSAMRAGGVATSSLDQKVKDISATYQNTTRIGNEVWERHIATLIRFGATEDNIEGVAEAAKNLAGLYNGDVQQATNALRKALEGQFDSFSEVGIIFEKTGDQARDLETLFTLIAERGGGLLEDRARTLQGQTDGLANSFGDMQEAIGGRLAGAPGVPELLDDVTTSLDGLATSILNTTPELETLATDFTVVAENAAEVTDALETINEATLEDSTDGADNLTAAYETLRNATDQAAIANVRLMESTGELSAEDAARQVALIQRRRELDTLATAETDISARREESFEREAAAAKALQTAIAQLDRARTQFAEDNEGGGTLLGLDGEQDQAAALAEINTRSNAAESRLRAQRNFSQGLALPETSVLGIEKVGLSLLRNAGLDIGDERSRFSVSRLLGRQAGGFEALTGSAGKRAETEAQIEELAVLKVELDRVNDLQSTVNQAEQDLLQIKREERANLELLGVESETIEALRDTSNLTLGITRVQTGTSERARNAAERDAALIDVRARAAGGQASVDLARDQLATQLTEESAAALEFGAAQEQGGQGVFDARQAAEREQRETAEARAALRNAFAVQSALSAELIAIVGEFVLLSDDQREVVDMLHTQLGNQRAGD